MDGDPHSNWQQLTKLALSIIAIVGIVIVPQLPPLISTRPNVAPPLENRFVSAQNVDARLWQDPFEAVALERDRRRAEGGATASVEARRNSAKQLQDDIARYTGKGSQLSRAPVLVLLAFVPGGPYPENGESRRRTRYAVMSGLRASGLTPIDAEHIAYFEPQASTLPFLSPMIVYEWLTATTSRQDEGVDKVLLVWLDERVFGQDTVRKAAALLREMGICHAPPVHKKPRVVMLGPAESGSVRSLAEDREHVDAVDRQCVEPLVALSTATLPDDYVIPGWGAPSPVPGSLKERMGPLGVEDWLMQSGVYFIRMLPTDDRLTAELLEELKARRLDLTTKEAEKKPDPPALDTAGEQTSENEKQTIEPGPRVAVLSEWDTLYGRRGVELLSFAVCRERRGWTYRGGGDSWCGGRIRLFEYQRGLDGVIPGRDAKKSGDQAEKAPASQFQREPDPGERANGTPQLDYVRRLAAEFERLISSDDAQRAGWQDDKSLVIAVLGSDIYDKLLILKAFRPQHPQATFVTFDLDARMLHSDEFNWVRNLIVVSPLGLRLRPELQGSMPPFRDSYQTAYFLSARTAVDYIRSGMAPDALTRSFKLAWTPRVFEIGRGTAFDLSIDGGDGPCTSAIHCSHLTAKPDVTRLATSRRDWSWLALAGLAGMAVLVFSSSARRVVRTSLRGRRGRLAWIGALAAAAAVGAFLVRDSIPPGVATAFHSACARVIGSPSVCMLTTWFDEARPEPFSWTGGVSMWPTQIIRGAAALLVLAFCFVASRAVRASTRMITRRYSLVGPPRQGSAAMSGSNGHGDPPVAGDTDHSRTPRRPPAIVESRWHAFREAITLAGFDRLGRERPVAIAELWAEYRLQSQGWRMVARVALTALLAFLVAMCFMMYFGFPHRPGRGHVIFWTDVSLLFLVCVPLFLWLQMYVIDVIRLCEKVTKGLAAERPTTWPLRARGRFWSTPPVTETAASETPGSQTPIGAEPLRVAPAAGTAVAELAMRAPNRTAASVAHDDLAYWLDIRFTADWTARLSWLVYLPFVAVCLMIVARSRVLDGWDTPPGLYIGFGLSLAYMVACVGVLMHRATRLRRNALRHLRTHQRRLVGTSGSAQELERVKLMVEDVQRVDAGAFAPLTRQPIFGALAVLFGGAGITAVINYLMGIV